MHPAVHKSVIYIWCRQQAAAGSGGGAGNEAVQAVCRAGPSKRTQAGAGGISEAGIP